MMRYGDLELVATIFHELAHQLIYVKGDSEFNESFAVSVEQEGLRRWLAARGRSVELQHFLDQSRAEQQIIRAFAAGRAQLDSLYHEPLSVDRMRERKHELLAGIAEHVRALEHQYQLGDGYGAWIEGRAEQRSPGLDCHLLRLRAGIPAPASAQRRKVTGLLRRRQEARARPGRAPRAVRHGNGGGYGNGCGEAIVLGYSHSGVQALKLAGCSPRRWQPFSWHTLSTDSER